MIKTEYLNTELIVKDKRILTLFRAVENHGGVLRFVGGAVRDVLAGKTDGFEIDLATDLSPDELVEACQEENLKTVPIGLKYATTGVVIADKIVEVSHLRKTGTGYRFSSEFEFTDDWSTDASKRDLTINAVYADERGNVFDYYNGIEDLENGIVKFIGNPEDRIKEAPIRIMRFFRFYSIFGKTEPHLKSLKACIENKHLLKTVAIEHTPPRSAFSASILQNTPRRRKKSSRTSHTPRTRTLQYSYPPRTVPKYRTARQFRRFPKVA